MLFIKFLYTLCVYGTFFKNMGLEEFVAATSSPLSFLYTNSTRFLAFGDSWYSVFNLPPPLRKFSTHPSLSILSNRFTFHDIKASNSLNLSLEKYPSDFKNRSISSSPWVNPYFTLT